MTVHGHHAHHGEFVKRHELDIMYNEINMINGNVASDGGDSDHVSGHDAYGT